MKIKTSELNGAALDWSVAKCLGKENTWGKSPFIPYDYHMGYRYSQEWRVSGPIIEKEKIAVQYLNGAWRATLPTDELSGPTLLVAALRCFVASKLGDTVDVPDELKGAE